jgi:hypothetical protein
VILRFVLAAYFAALAAMPFAHHDVLCHLKSSTHCSTCHVGTSADPGGTQPSLAAADFADAGLALARSSTAIGRSELSASAGRAPPAASSTSLS